MVAPFSPGRAAHARPVLVHSIPREQIVPAIASEWIPRDKSEELLREARETTLDKVAHLAHGEARAVVEIGEPHRVLLEQAEDPKVGMILLGAADRNEDRPRWLGGTADRVLRKAACPVLIVRQAVKHPPARVVFPVDLSALSADAFRSGLELLAELGWSQGAHLTALYVESPPVAPLPVELLTANGPLRELERFVHRHRPAGRPEVETKGRQGEAREPILRGLEECDAGLVVLGTHGRGGFERLLLGSVASDLIRTSPCDVLVLPPAEAARTRVLAWNRRPGMRRSDEEQGAQFFG